MEPCLPADRAADNTRNKLPDSKINVVHALLIGCFQREARAPWLIFGLCSRRGSTCTPYGRMRESRVDLPWAWFTRRKHDHPRTHMLNSRSYPAFTPAAGTRHAYETQEGGLQRSTYLYVTSLGILVGEMTCKKISVSSPDGILRSKIIYSLPTGLCSILRPDVSRESRAEATLLTIPRNT